MSADRRRPRKKAGRPGVVPLAARRTRAAAGPNPEALPPAKRSEKTADCPQVEPSIEEIEARLVLDAVRARYGFDFRDFDPAAIRPKLETCRRRERLRTLSALQERVLRDPKCMERCLLDLANHAAPMFHDPLYYRALREIALPLLRTWPYLRVWQVGCSSVEELYATAIILLEEEVYDRTRIYATDLSDVAVRRAEDGALSLKAMKAYAANYLRAGGRAALSDYYSAKSAKAVLHADLKRNIVFSRHNFVTDGPFNEFNLILCRNVVAEFRTPLRAQVLRLFNASLCRFGILGIGEPSLLVGSGLEDSFEPLDSGNRLFRKIQ
jgi:chemotaxis protein methyltransferase CheR